jgi:hypothetical protein
VVGFNKIVPHSKLCNLVDFAKTSQIPLDVAQNCFKHKSQHNQNYPKTQHSRINVEVALHKGI